MSCSSSSSTTSTRRGVNRRPRGRPRIPGWRRVLESRAAASGLGRPSTRVGRSRRPLRRLVAEQVQVVELDRPAVLDDGVGRRPRTVRIQSANSSALDTVADRQTRSTLGRGLDDDLLPDRAPVGVLEVVDLVEDHVAQALEAGRPGVDHVAQHLGGHDDDRGVAVDGVVPGQQPDRLRPVAADQLAVLLVRQRLERGGVERLAALGQGPVHGVLRHHRLARPGRRGHHHAAAGVEGVEGLPLEPVQLEAAAGPRTPDRESITASRSATCAEPGR